MDDTTCFLKYHASLTKALDTFKRFSISSGLQLNFNKTTATYIGSLKDSDYYPYGLSWIKASVPSLGIIFTTLAKENYLLNCRPRITKLKNTLQLWSQRGLTLKGKVAILNSVALTPLIYLSSVIDTPDSVIKEVDNIITEFL